MPMTWMSATGLFVPGDREHALGRARLLRRHGLRRTAGIGASAGDRTPALILVGHGAFQMTGWNSATAGATASIQLVCCSTMRAGRVCAPSTGVAFQRSRRLAIRGDGPALGGSRTAPHTPAIAGALERAVCGAARRSPASSPASRRRGAHADKARNDQRGQHGPPPSMTNWTAKRRAGCRASRDSTTCGDPNRRSMRLANRNAQTQMPQSGRRRRAELRSEAVNRGLAGE